MKTIPKPVRISDYVRVFHSAPQVYNGPDGTEVRKHRFYQNYVQNDHTFVGGPDGRIHLFGITHPETSPANIHDGELLLCHGICPGDPFRPDAFVDCGNVLPPDDRPGDLPEIHSPAIVHQDGLYRMVYGPLEFRQLISRDLFGWERGDLLLSDPEEGSRDPQISQVGGTYFLCYCKGNAVMLARSSDFIRWSEPRKLLELPPKIAPESPFLYHRDGVFYLLVCLWDPALWSGRDIAGAYQAVTLVFAADDAALQFSYDDVLVKIDSHAPEILEYGNRVFISSAEYPTRGIHLAELGFVK